MHINKIFFYLTTISCDFNSIIYERCEITIFDAMFLSFSDGASLVFGIPLMQCITNDRLSEGRTELRRRSHHGSRTSCSSLAEAAKPEKVRPAGSSRVAPEFYERRQPEKQSRRAGCITTTVNYERLQQIIPNVVLR